MTPDRYLANYMGRAAGVTGGKDGNMHFGDRALGCVGMVSMLPDMALVATGMALAFKMRCEPRVAMTFFGEGSTANGQWHEAMNFAGIHRLPVVFVLENNRFAYSTPNELEFAVDPVERAHTYGFPGVNVDGNDVEAVFEAAREAVERRPGGRRPDADRVPDDADARPRRPRRHELRARRSCSRSGRGATRSSATPSGSPRTTASRPSEVEEIRVRGARLRRRVRRQGARVADARSRAGGRRVSSPTSWRAARRRPGALVAGVARPQRQRRDAGLQEGGMSGLADAPERATGTREMTYLRRSRTALREEMRRDETVFCLGEDIGAFGGAFKVTDGFVEEFGADRVPRHAARGERDHRRRGRRRVEGLRPVCEMQFADFIACGFDQLVNVAAKLHYRQGIAVPMVVRLPSGGGFSGGPFHSQNPEAWFLQAPGLKVVAPATAADAKGLLVSAIRDPNPVCYLEHKGLYRHVKGEVPEGEYAVPLGEARIAREGGELTVIAYGSSVHLALAGGGGARARTIEVLDLRTLCPLDREAILASVRKTGQGAGRPRGDPLVRGRRRGRGADRRARPSRTSTRRSGGSPRPTCRSRSARRSSRPSCPSSTT